MLYDDALASVSRVTGASMPALSFSRISRGHVAALFGAVVAIGRVLYRSWWAVAMLAALLTLRHRITQTGANSLEAYFQPRMLAFALGAWAIAAYLRGPGAAALGALSRRVCTAPDHAHLVRRLDRRRRCSCPSVHGGCPLAALCALGSCRRSVGCHARTAARTSRTAWIRCGLRRWQARTTSFLPTGTPRSGSSTSATFSSRRASTTCGAAAGSPLRARPGCSPAQHARGAVSRGVAADGRGRGACAATSDVARVLDARLSCGPLPGVAAGRGATVAGNPPRGRRCARRGGRGRGLFVWRSEHAGSPVARVGFPQDNWTDAMKWISRTPADTSRAGRSRAMPGSTARVSGSLESETSISKR